MTLSARRAILQAIRQRVAPSVRAFAAQFHIPVRRMEAYEQGRRRPDPVMVALLRVIEREPAAALRAMGG